MSSEVLKNGSNFAETVLLKKHVKCFTEMLKNPKNKKILKWTLISSFSLLLIGLLAYFYFANLTHDDTATLKADYKVEAIPFIKEFEKDYKTANKKYAEKIIAVKGTVTATLLADTTITIEMKDSTTGSYLVFDFQQQHLEEAKKLKQGDRTVIKGIFSDGIYSDIKEAYFINFQRSIIEK